MPQSSRILDLLVYYFGIDIRDSQLIEEYILFGFSFNNKVMHVLNLCILYAKYYINIQCLFINNTLNQTLTSIENKRKYMYKHIEEKIFIIALYMHLDSWLFIIS